MNLVSSVIAVAMLAASPAIASTVTATDTLTGVARGATTVTTFNSLAASDGTGGILTLVGDGLDLGTNPSEWMDVDIDGISLGRWECNSSPNSGGTDIPGRTGLTDCDFTLPLSISGTDLNTVLADSTADITISFGSNVNVMSSSDFLRVTLEYNSGTPAVPLPASAWLLVAGLGMIGAAKRRRKAS